MDYSGQRLGNYLALYMLGMGSFANVYLGRHIYLKTEVAIKILFERLDMDATERFLLEARFLSGQEHPHIVRMYDADVVNGVAYLTMDYVPAGTLRALHPAGGALPLSTIVGYVRQIASALMYAHERRFMHRNLKPENVLVGEGGRLLLSDFGITLPARGTDIASVQAGGETLAYMAPEQLRGKPGAASDQYALAALVYEWLSGHLPFVGDTAELCGQHLFVAPPSLYQAFPELLPEVERVIFKALAKHPLQRFATVGAFAEALEDACLLSGVSRTITGG